MEANNSSRSGKTSTFKRRYMLSGSSNEEQIGSSSFVRQNSDGLPRRTVPEMESPPTFQPPYLHPQYAPSNPPIQIPVPRWFIPSQFPFYPPTDGAPSGTIRNHYIRSNSYSSDSSISSQRGLSSSLDWTSGLSASEDEGPSIRRPRDSRRDSGSLRLKTESLRGQRIQAEQRRRQEALDAYTRLKEVLPVAVEGNTKLSLLEFARSHIIDTDTKNALLKAEVMALKQRVASLRELLERSLLLLHERLSSSERIELSQISMDRGDAIGSLTVAELNARDDPMEEADERDGSGSGSGEISFAESRTSSSFGSASSLHGFMRKTGTSSPIRR